MKILKSQCAPRDYKVLAPKLLASFTGSLDDDAKSMDLQPSDYQTDECVEKLLAFIRKRINITDLSLETDAFDKHFMSLARKKGETLLKYINAEETAYRRLQKVLKQATEGGGDEYNEDEEVNVDDPKKRRCKLPKRLRGWLFLERAAIPAREYSGM